MVLLNTGLCLPRIDIEALYQGKSIVAITNNFMVPGKRFILYPITSNLSQENLNYIYRADFLDHLQGDLNSQLQEVITWATCEFCKAYSEKEQILSIATKTIWSSQYLETQFNIKENLFLTFLQVYKLSKSLIFQDLQEGRIGGFIPLPKYFDVDESNPVLNKERFGDSKNRLLNPTIELVTPSIEGKNFKQPKETLLVKEKIEAINKVEGSIVDHPNWFEQIARVGNSSDGHTFEKLVRKSLLELGFYNSLDDPKVSLDPHATGGAGGLDFYCDYPYPVVGECKATTGNSVPTETSTKLIQLGQKHLGAKHYNQCIKVIVAGGKLTKDADKIAVENNICLIRAETLQRLVCLKRSYSGSFTLQQLKECLEKTPFSQESDKYVDLLIRKSWDQLQIRSLLVEAARIIPKLKSRPASTDAIQNFYNGKFASDDIPPLINNAYTRDILIELSSPLTGYLGRTQDANSGEEGFYFIRELKIEN